MQYGNQRKSTVRPVRLGMLLLIIILLAMIGFTQMEKAKKNALTTNSTLATKPTPVDDLSVSLNTTQVAQAEIIEYKILSSQQAQVGGEPTLGIVAVATPEWQGDFTKERIAATLLQILHDQNKDQKTVVSIYLLPVAVSQELMFSEIALGRLILNPENPEQNSMAVVKRGYLPQELDYIKLYESLRPKFVKDGILDSQAFNKAITDQLGPEFLGMEYPFLKLLQVEEYSINS